MFISLPTNLGNNSTGIFCQAIPPRSIIPMKNIATAIGRCMESMRKDITLASVSLDQAVNKCMAAREVTQ